MSAGERPEGATGPAPAPGARQVPPTLAEALAPLCAPGPGGDAAVVAAPMLAALADAMQATRVSLMLVDPGTGRFRIVAGLGMPESLVGREIEWRPQSVSEWVYRKRQGLVLNGVVKRHDLVGTGDREVGTSMCLPLETDGRVIGVLNLGACSAASPYHEALLAEVASLLPPVADAIDRALTTRRTARLAAQADAARGLAGRTLLRPGRHEARFWETGYARLSCLREGGAIAERVPLASGGQVLLALEPRAEGIEALLAAAFAQGVFAALAASEKSAAALMARLNAELCTRLGGRGEMAAWIGLQSAGGALASCSAGFPAPLWLPGDGTETVHLQAGGPMIGAEVGAVWDEEQVRLFPGDVVVAASSGVLGARNVTAAPFGPARIEERAREQLRAPLDLLTDDLLRGVLAWTGRPLPVADLSILAVRYAPES